METKAQPSFGRMGRDLVALEIEIEGVAEPRSENDAGKDANKDAGKDVERDIERDTNKDVETDIVCIQDAKKYLKKGVENGIENGMFRVHRDLLISESHYLEAAFENELFCERKEKKIKIAKTSVQTMEDFKDWLYYRRLPVTTYELIRDKMDTSTVATPDDMDDCCLCKGPCRRPPGETSTGQPLSEEEEMERLEEVINDGSWQLEALYVFADRYEIPALRRAIVDWYFHDYTSCSSASPWNDSNIYLMRHLLISSRLIILMIGVCADRFHPKSELLHGSSTAEADA